MCAAPGFAFAAIGINHAHIQGLVQVMLDAGGRLTSFFPVEDDLAAAFARKCPRAVRVADERAGIRYADRSTTPITYGEQPRDDVMNRTETAIPRAHGFCAKELALAAQTNAERLAGACPARAVS